MANVIPTGPYMGFSLTELRTELERYKAARTRSYSQLTGSTVNGQTFTFGSRTDGSIEQWQQELQTALSYLDPGHYPFPAPTNRSVGRPFYSVNTDPLLRNTFCA